MSLTPLFEGDDPLKILKAIRENASNVRFSIYGNKDQANFDHGNRLAEAIQIEDKDQRLAYANLSSSLKYEQTKQSEAIEKLDTILKQLDILKEKIDTK